MHARAALRIPIARSIAIAITIALVSLAPSPSDAQCPELAVGCHEEGVEFHWREGFLDSVMLDTGWVPAGSPLQVRFALFVGGETEIDLAGTSFTWWRNPLSVAVPGIPGTGRFSVDYGLEFIARVRFDVEVAGTRYTWEGDIPTGSIPRDLRLAAMTGFDSMLLPPQTPRPVSIMDATERFEAFSVGLGSLISIPGVDGGLVVEVEAALSAAYRTERIEIGDAIEPIVEEGAFTIAGADMGETDFGAAKDVVIAPVGALDYDGTVTFHPTLFIEVPGRRFDMPIAAVPVPVADLAREVRFDPVTVHVPLPDARIVPRSIDFGEVAVGEAVTESLELRNEGEAELRIVPRMARMPFSVATTEVVIPPRSSRVLEIGFAPTEPERTEAMLFLESNDPDESLVIVRLSGEGIGTALGDGGVGDGGMRRPGADTDGGCSCRVGARPSSGWAAIALGIGLALAFRRRR